ncbi:MAG: HTH domain-containing protein [Bacteroidota bacterium]
MKRLHRLTSLLIRFQSSKTVHAKQLSKVYDVSTRTIYRDIKALEEAGVPIGHEPGESFFLLEGYQLPPVHFTPEESQAIITANALVQQNSDRSLVENFENAVRKILAVLRSTNKTMALQLQNRIAPSTTKGNPTSDNLLTIQKSIVAFQRLQLTYRNADGSTSFRKIDPLALYSRKTIGCLLPFANYGKRIASFG